MKLVDRRTGLEVISREECVALLATKQVGRLAFVSGGRPDVLPVNYAMDGDAVVFATAEGSKLAAVGRWPVTFEIDDLDEASRTGWSVVVHGMAEEISTHHSPHLLERLRALPLSPWAAFDKPYLVRITPTTVTGRRLGTPSYARATPSESSSSLT